MQFRASTRVNYCGNRDRHKKTTPVEWSGFERFAKIASIVELLWWWLVRWESQPFRGVDSPVAVDHSSKS